MANNCTGQMGIQEGPCPQTQPLDLGCVPRTSGMPSYIPEADQLPFAYDEATGSLWIFACETPEEWVEIANYSNCNLETIDTTLIGDICNALHIPVIADTAAGCVDGKVTLSTLVQHIQECICATITQDPTEATSAITCDSSGAFVERPITPLCDQVTSDPTEATSALECIDGALVSRPITPLCEQVTPDPTIATTTLNCGPGGGLVEQPLPVPATPTALPACVDTTIGMPIDIPDTTAGETIFRWDACSGILWFYTCDDGWRSQRISLAVLTQLDPSVLADICSDLRIPAFYDIDGCPVQGYLTAQELAEELCRCFVCDDDLPSGAVILTSGVVGSHVIVHDGSGDPHGASSFLYEYEKKGHTFTVADYPFLGTVGNVVNVSVSSTQGYFMTVAAPLNSQVNSISPYQGDTRLYFNTGLVKDHGDAYGLNKNGHNSTFADVWTEQFITNGADLFVETAFTFLATDPNAQVGDSLHVDMARALVSLHKGV